MQLVKGNHTIWGIGPWPQAFLEDNQPPFSAVSFKFEQALVVHYSLLRTPKSIKQNIFGCNFTLFEKITCNLPSFCQSYTMDQIEETGLRILGITFLGFRTNDRMTSENTKSLYPLSSFDIWYICCAQNYGD